jgi:CheY-like chemotaxis protein
MNDPEQEAQRAPQAGREGAEAAPGAGRGVLLLVDDEAALVALFRTVLEQAGHTVLAAGHGEEALRVHEGYPGRIDLLVTDVAMPGMSGPELAQRLTARQPSLKVLYVSGHVLGIEDLGVPAAGAAFLAKPFPPEALERKVAEVLAG